MDGTWRDLLRADRVARLALVCLGIWLNAADALVTATAMPSIVRDIGGYAYFACPVATYLVGASKQQQRFWTEVFMTLRR